MTESYTRVKAILHVLTRDAAQISVTDKGALLSPVWLPRSLIHGADDLKLAKAMKNDEVTVRVMDWKANELGLIPARQPNQSEMDF
jgi:hypothetical protein